MIKNILAGVLVCLSLTGCAKVESAINTMSSPKATQAANNAAKFAMAVDCGVVVPLSQLSTQIAQIVQAGNAAIDTTGKVYGVSQAVCNTITSIVDGTK